MPWSQTVLTLSIGATSLSVSLLDVAVFSLTFLAIVAGAYVFGRIRRAKSNSCHWKRAREQTRPPFVKWHCRSCAEDAFSIDGSRPSDCKRDLKSRI
jgi:hypothetical protein